MQYFEILQYLLNCFVMLQYQSIAILCNSIAIKYYWNHPCAGVGLCVGIRDCARVELCVGTGDGAGVGLYISTRDGAGVGLYVGTMRCAGVVLGVGANDAIGVGSGVGTCDGAGCICIDGSVALSNICATWM